MIIAYKGFKKDLTCRGYQFRENKVHIEKEANCAKNGLHCAENPLDCLSYYDFNSKNVFYIVAAGGTIHEDGSDTKISCTKMKLIKKLSRESFVAEALLYISRHPNLENHRLVFEDYGESNSNGFAIVRGCDPVAKGKKGNILGFAKEDEHGEIEEINILKVDGKTIQENTWYGIDGVIREIEAYEDEN